MWLHQADSYTRLEINVCSKKTLQTLFYSNVNISSLDVFNNLIDFIFVWYFYY